MTRLVLLVLLALPLCAQADVLIDPKCHIQNDDHISCVLCSLETIARHLHVDPLHNLKTNRQRTRPFFHGEIPETICPILDSLGVGYGMQLPGNTDTTIILDSLKADVPVAIGLAHKHMVVLVGLNDKEAKIVDSEFPGQVKTMTRAQFDSVWDGWVVVLNKVAVVR